MTRRPSGLTVAGSDPSGGAGLELDLQVLAHLGVPGSAIATCLSDQDSRGVKSVRALPVKEGLARLATVLSDQDLPAAKIGLLPSPAWVRGLAGSGLFRSVRVVILDPIRSPTKGAATLTPKGREALVRWMLPEVDLLTPNLPEAAWLLGWTPREVQRDPESALQGLLDLGPANVLLKGGHLRDDERLVDRLRGEWGRRDFRGKRHPGPVVRGTGCALTAAIVAGIVHGEEPPQSVSAAVRFVREAIRRASPRGRGRPELGLPDPTRRGGGKTRAKGFVTEG